MEMNSTIEHDRSMQPENEEQDIYDGEVRELDAFDASLGKAISDLTKALEHSDDPENGKEDVGELSKKTLQALYMLARDAHSGSNGLSELYVDGFDSEQIWGQLDASTKPSLKRARKQIKKLEGGVNLLDDETESALDDLLKGYSQEAGTETFQDDSDQEDSLSGEEEEGEEEDEEENGGKVSHGKMNPKAGRKLQKKRKSMERPKLPTEDDFFNLDDMENFVQDAEITASNLNEQVDAEDQDFDDNEDDEESDEGEVDSETEGLNLDAIHGLQDEDEDSEEGNIQENESELDESEEDEDDADLSRLLERATGRISNLGGRKRKIKALEDTEDGIFYDDFFGSGPGNPSKEKVQKRHDNISKEAQVDISDPEMDDFKKDSDLDKDHMEEEEDMSEGGIGEEREVDDDSDGQEQLLSTLRKMIDTKKAEEMKSHENMSAHERRVLRVAERARKLEAENMGEKDWHMKGETRAEKRPLNSALEVDLDFERALKPPPQPTEEFTSSLEDLIKRRINENQFDDPVRRAPPPEDLQKELTELDDKKASKGLGEEYADDFVRAKTGNAVEDKDEKTREECRVLLKTLFSKLDALSHFHFAPKPIIKEMAIQKEVPALALEEVGPQVVSEAIRQLPEEAYQVNKKSQRKEIRESGDVNRKTARSNMKEAMRKRKAKEAEERRQKGEDTNGVANIVGRKSAKQEDQNLAASKREKKKLKRARTRPDEGPKIKYNKSAAVFGKIQDAKDGLKKTKLDQITSKSLKL